MNSIWQVFVSSLKGGTDSEVSSRRLITMLIMLICMFVNTAAIVLSFIVATRSPEANASPIQALDRLIEVIIITYVAILLLIGLITWQNVNDTISLVRGVVPQNVVKAADDIQDKAQEIKETIGVTTGTKVITPQPSTSSTA